MTYTGEPMQLLKQPDQRMQLANMLSQQQNAPFQNINDIVKNMAFKQGMTNKNLGDWGLNNDFGPQGIPVGQWMNMRGR